MNKKTSFIKAAFIFAMALTMTTAAYAVDACKDQEMGHVGEGTKVEGQKQGSITDIPWGFLQWSQNESNYMTYYSNGTFKAEWEKAGDYIAGVGFFYDKETGVDYTTKNYAVDFKYTKTGSAQYSYIGAYGWATNPIVEFYIVDDWYGEKFNTTYIGDSLGEITVDGAKYTIHAFLRQHAPVDFDPSNLQTFVQIFSVRETPRQCGHINISAHLKKWSELFKGQEVILKGDMGNAKTELLFSKNVTKVLFINETMGASGSIDFTYLNMEENASSSSEVIESSSSSEESSSSETLLVDVCKDETGHVGEGTTILGKANQSVYGNLGNSDYHYEVWYNIDKEKSSNKESITYYDNSTFKVGWNEPINLIARIGFKYDEKHTYEELGPIDAYFKWSKQGNAGAYNYFGVYGWTVDPLVEFYIVDDWFNKPGILGQKKGEFTVDGETYEIYQNMRYNAPSIKNSADFPQYISVRKTARQCGHINVTAHFKKWKELGMKMGKMYEAKLLAEVGGGSGSLDVTYFKMTDAEHPLLIEESSSSTEESSSSEEAKSSSSKVQESSSSEEESSSSESIKSSSSDEPESSSSAEESSSSAAESSSSEEEYTTTLSANIHLNNTDKNLQIFDMQGRFLGTTLFTRETDMQATVKALVQRSGNYIVRQNGYVYKISVK